MFSKFKKYIVGFFVLLGGILVAFLSGKSSGRKDEKFKNIKTDSKKIKKRIKENVIGQKAIEKSLKSKQKALDEMKKTKNEGYKNKDVNADDAKKYLKSYLKNKK